jgi:hypothetical protein
MITPQKGVLDACDCHSPKTVSPDRQSVMLLDVVDESDQTGSDDQTAKSCLFLVGSGSEDATKL